MPIEIGSTGSTKQGNEAEKSLKKYHDAAKKCEQTLLGMRRKFQAPTLKARLGTIDKQIHQADQKTQPDVLTRLPPELATKVWSFLDDPGDRLMLALSCKGHASMFEALKTSKQQPQANTKKRKATSPASDSEKSKKPRKIGRKAPTRTEVIPILQRLHDWMSQNKAWQLCYICVRYRPRINTWSNGASWGGKVQPWSTRKCTPTVLKRLEMEGHRCPECSERKELEFHRETQKWKETKKTIDRNTGLNS